MGSILRTSGRDSLSARREAQMGGGWEAHQAERAAAAENMARLRALRMAREAQGDGKASPVALRRARSKS